MGADAFWSTHVFVLVSPDTIRRGLAGALADRLRHEGFTPVAGRLVRTTPEMIDELYAEVIAGQWRTWQYRLVDLAFAAGPTLAMICRYTGDAADPHALMRVRKGHSSPQQCPPGTIRHDFGAMNTILGVMHASDNPAESATDAAVFGLSESDAGVDGGPVDQLCALTVGRQPESRDYEAVLADVRAKCLLAAWPDLPDPLRYKLRAEFPVPAALGAADAGGRLAALLDGELPDAFVEVVGCEFTPQWRVEHRGVQVFATLHRHGVELDTWERLVLETSLHFPSVRRGRAA